MILLETSEKHEIIASPARDMLGSAVVVLAPSLLPGWGLATVLDGTSDRLRKSLLAPALGLLLFFGVSGSLLLLNVWSIFSLFLAMLLMNFAAYRVMTKRHEEVAKRTRWQMLEAAMHGEVSDVENGHLNEEAERQRDVRKTRQIPLFYLSGFIAATALLIPFLQSIPFGVDWIGFSVITQNIMMHGGLVFSGLNEGFWTYPPAFPSIAAWVAIITSVDAATAVFHLGHYSLFVLLLGMMGAFDRHGAGPHGILSMALGIGLFAKTFDSGYPTVASQLGLVVGILVLLRPVKHRHRHHTVGLVIALACVTLIHPTGAIYLAALLFAHVLYGIQLKDEVHQELMRKIALVASIFITVGFAIALLVMAPRLFAEAVFSEYGWQGGRPMLVYNGLLVLLGCLAAWDLRMTLEGRILMTWFASLWLLSAIHLVEGLQDIPLLSLLSYTLYSMALHAFHIPLAALIALRWSPFTELYPIEGIPNTSLRSVPEGFTRTVAACLLVATLGAQSMALMLDEHHELQALTPSDLELRDRLTTLGEANIYTENSHWGHLWNLPSSMDSTSLPTLGLVYLEHSEQINATQAIYHDNVSYFLEHDMHYALTSPLGSIQWVLSQSPYWTKHWTVDASALWLLQPEGNASVNQLVGISQSDCDGCEERLDPWRNHRFRDPLQLGEVRAFLPEGQTGLLELKAVEGASSLCLVYETIGNTGGVYFSNNAGIQQLEQPLNREAGYHITCMELTESSNQTEIKINWENPSPDSWLNPLALSGRDSSFLDQTGLRLHWIEWEFKENTMWNETVA